jgi:acid phosphatase
MSPALPAFLAALVIAALAGCATGVPAPIVAAAPPGLDRIENIVVIYAENHSFDNMYGMFPGANGIAHATAEQKTQLDHDGKPLPHLPPVYGGKGVIDARYPSDLPNGPFRIDAPPINANIGQIVPSPTHDYYRSIEQINGGKNNMFVAMSDVGAWAMGHYDGSSQRVWQWAREYTLADNFFMGAFGGSFINHQWLICACTPVFRDAPAEWHVQLDERGKLKKKPTSPTSVLDGPVQVYRATITPDGYAVSTSQPPYQPSDIPPATGGNPDLADPAKHPLPPQTAKTIGDTLSDKGVSWAWYSGAWNAALADGRQDPAAKRKIIYNDADGSPNFQSHHQPFNYFLRYAPGTAARAEHLKDGEEFIKAIDGGKLPQVTFYKPQGNLNEHAGYSAVLDGDTHLADVVSHLEKSPQWPNMLVVVTYDENGGFWDHVAPPKADRWGPGTRVPAIIVSPFAKKGVVDHTLYDTTSILRFITRKFELPALRGLVARDEALRAHGEPPLGDLTAALDLPK